METLPVFERQQAPPVPDPKSRYAPIMNTVKTGANLGAQTFTYRRQKFFLLLPLLSFRTALRRGIIAVLVNVDRRLLVMRNLAFLLRTTLFFFGGVVSFLDCLRFRFALPFRGRGSLYLIIDHFVRFAFLPRRWAFRVCTRTFLFYNWWTFVLYSNLVSMRHGRCFWWLRTKAALVATLIAALKPASSSVPSSSPYSFSRVRLIKRVVKSLSRVQRRFKQNKNAKRSTHLRLPCFFAFHIIFFAASSSSDVGGIGMVGLPAEGIRRCRSLTDGART